MGYHSCALLCKQELGSAELLPCILRQTRKQHGWSLLHRACLEHHPLPISLSPLLLLVLIISCSNRKRFSVVWAGQWTCSQFTSCLKLFLFDQKHLAAMLPLLKVDGAEKILQFPLQRSRKGRTRTHTHRHVKYFLLLLTFSCHDESVMSPCDSTAPPQKDASS